MFIRIGGVCGSGKTTLVSALANIAKDLRLPIQAVKGGDILLQLAGVSTYDELRALPEDIRASLRPEMYRYMYEIDRRTPNILRLRDAHFTLIENEQVVQCPCVAEDRTQMYALVLLTASPETILGRRLCDTNRPDRNLELRHIREELEIEASEAHRQSEATGLPLKIIKSENLVDSCVQLSGIFPEHYGRASIEAYLSGSGKERIRGMSV